MREWLPIGNVVSDAGVDVTGLFTEYSFVNSHIFLGWGDLTTNYFAGDASGGISPLLYCTR
jgi:hypothetical protein